MKVHVTAIADTINEIKEFDSYQSMVEFMESEHHAWVMFWGPFNREFMDSIYDIDESADLRIEKYDDYRE